MWCQFLSRESKLSYEESTDQLVRFVDQPLIKAMAGAPLPKSYRVRQSICVIRLGLKPEKVYPNYAYHFPLEALGEHPDRLVQITEEFWRDEGFKISEEDESGVVRSFAALERGLPRRSW